MANVLDLKEFKEVLKTDYGDISERVEYIIDELFDEGFNYVFEDFDVFESSYELESLAPKDFKNVIKVRLTDYSKQPFDEFVSLYAELNDFTNKECAYGYKKEGLLLNFYEDNLNNISHQINHINFKESDKLFDLVNNFKKRYGDNTIINLTKKYLFNGINLSKN